jgi:hypothetical protein
VSWHIRREIAARGKSFSFLGGKLVLASRSCYPFPAGSRSVQETRGTVNMGSPCWFLVHLTPGTLSGGCVAGREGREGLLR